MIPEIGHIALILAFCVALLQGVIPLVGAQTRRANWMEFGDHDQLIIPYTLEANDMRYATAPGYIEGEQFFTYLRDAFDVLYAEGEHAPKMMTIGLHNRIIGKPARFRALQRFIDYGQHCLC